MAISTLTIKPPMQDLFKAKNFNKGAMITQGKSDVKRAVRLLTDSEGWGRECNDDHLVQRGRKREPFVSMTDTHDWGT